jgi:hypothetical protein
MSTTPNYNWPLIENTDFVTNLPADLETLADAIDASFAANEGDLLIGGTSNIFEALAIGAAGTVLTSDGDTADWVTPSAPSIPNQSFTLLNSGNTSLGSGSSFTVSGISGINTLHIIVIGARSSSASMQPAFRINGDSSGLYDNISLTVTAAGSYSASIVGAVGNLNQTDIITATNASNNESNYHGYLRIFGANTTDPKVYHGFAAASRGDGGTGQTFANYSGVYRGTSTISSIEIRPQAGNFSQGNIYIYGATS